jgi:hypothetical protein
MAELPREARTDTGKYGPSRLSQSPRRTNRMKSDRILLIVFILTSSILYWKRV